MRTVNSSVFQRTYHTLTEITVVTRDGQPMGTWTPYLGGEPTWTPEPPPGVQAPVSESFIKPTGSGATTSTAHVQDWNDLEDGRQVHRSTGEIRAFSKSQQAGRKSK